jgi:hypothetical protein
MTVVHLATHSQDTSPSSGESIKRFLPSNPAAVDVNTASAGSGASGNVDDATADGNDDDTNDDADDYDDDTNDDADDYDDDTNDDADDNV